MMTSIIRAEQKDSELLADLGKKTFIESHGHSASPSIVHDYVQKNFSTEMMSAELSEGGNIYHLIYYNGVAAGYSKILYNFAHPNIPISNVTKLERIYILKEFYSLDAGKILLDHNIQLSKSNQQNGMWLYVWEENQRAIRFYIKNGFKIIGRHDFQLSADHSNPNHQMLLVY